MWTLIESALDHPGGTNVIAFLGMGLLGTNFVRAMRRRGLDVHVWNRTPGKARALEADGARAFDEAAAAVQGATRVHLTLSDDTAVDDVLERARPGLGPDAVIVDHTTTSPNGTGTRVALWAERGVAFQHAPVFMGPQNALDATGIMLGSGERARFDALSPELAKMTGKLVYLGPQPDRAAAFKLFGNLFLMSMTAGIADVLALAKALGVRAEEAATLFDVFNPAASMGPRVKRILEGDYTHPSWELAMARKDARLMLEAADKGGMNLALVPAIATVMDRWIERGHAHDDWTIIAKDALA
jgi:3-hydroxyisobutyrate dehydrogenase